MPELASQKDLQKAILDATIDSWTGETQTAHGLGAIDTNGWAKSVEYLQSLGLVKSPVTVDGLVQSDLLPGGRVRARVWFPEERISTNASWSGAQTMQIAFWRRSALVHPDRSVGNDGTRKPSLGAGRGNRRNRLR